MKPSSLTALSAAAAIAVAAAAIAVSSRNAGQTPDGAGQYAIPGLLNVINDVASVSIEHKDGAFLLTRFGDGWSDGQRGGFPARGEAIRKLLIELAQLRQTDAKTKLKKNHGLLELIDPAGEGGNAKKITLKDKGGKVISTLLTGKNTSGREGGLGVYIRQQGSDQTWLSRSALELGVTPANWLETQIIDIKPQRVRRVAIRHPDGETLVVSKLDAAALHYAAENFPSGAKLESEFAADSLALALTGLELDEVAKTETISFGKDTVVKTGIATFDGLVVNVDLIELDRDYWIKLTASASEAPDMAKQASELNARFAPWVYRIDGHKAANMKKRLADILQKG